MLSTDCRSPGSPPLLLVSQDFAVTGTQPACHLPAAPAAETAVPPRLSAPMTVVGPPPRFPSLALWGTIDVRKTGALLVGPRTHVSSPTCYLNLRDRSLVFSLSSLASAHPGTSPDPRNFQTRANPLFLGALLSRHCPEGPNVLLLPSPPRGLS